MKKMDEDEGNRSETTDLLTVERMSSCEVRALRQIDGSRVCRLSKRSLAPRGHPALNLLWLYLFIVVEEEVFVGGDSGTY